MVDTPTTNEAWRRSVKEILSTDEKRTAKQSRKYGKSLRKAVPRDVFAAWQPPMGRPDPNELLFEQDKMRVQDLVPVRHERMGVSAFTFYRGAALVMASDLSSLPTTGIEVQACGDAHISNFGLYLSPERRTVFDINDFDETCRGPWEWDVARLAVSVEICGRDRGFTKKHRRKAVLAAVRGYRESMREFASKGTMEVWYAHFDADNFLARFGDELGASERKNASKTLNKSKYKDSVRAVGKFAEVVDGKLRIVSDPPLIVPLRNLAERAIGQVSESGEPEMAKIVSMVLRKYEKTLAPERAALVRQYHGVDMAHKVVGVGSVGLQAWIVVMEGATPDDVLVLQIKEATDSVLERFVGKAAQPNHGQRVVEGQHAMQTVSDALLGWTRLPTPKGTHRDFYVRQLWDGKGSTDLNRISAKGLTHLAKACGWTLAHAHARTGNRFAIASYLGKSDVFDEALYTFAQAYATQNEQDYETFVAATAKDAENNQ